MKTIPILPVAVEALPSEDTAGRIHARSVRGLFNRWRWAMIALTQMVFYGVPWLSWNDRQAVLFDLETRRFFLFNLV
ncbi:MAG: cytochrome c oxidase accessory protein CcoG, partial [Macromonas sp.]